MGEVTALLRCPSCHDRLTRLERSWRCAKGHAFDIARQGYVNLTAGRPAHTGDSPEMLDARAGIQHAGHFDAVTGAIVDACRGELPAGALIEVGAGTAHHLVAVRRALGQRPAIALDASVAAAKRAARADPDWTTAVVADAWRPWPVLDGVAALVLTVFAPRNVEETARVLAPEGLVVTVTPAPQHLAELVGPLGLVGIEPGKAARLDEDARGHLRLLDRREIRQVLHLGHAEVRAIAAMGPSAHHRLPAELAADVARLPPRVRVTLAVELTRFRPRRAEG